MTDLLIRPGPPDAEGRLIHVSPATAGWTYVGFDLFRMEAGTTLRRETEGREACLVLIAGRADVVAGDLRLDDIGERMGPFEGKKPYSVYVPDNSRFEVTARTQLELGLCSAPGKGSFPARLIPPDEVGFEERGEGSNRRLVYNILPEDAPADSLLVVEVVTPSGNWSSYPPHKHDTDDMPGESSLEETYYHRLDPPQGFAFQRVYTDDRSIDETLCVHDGDVVMVPRGYHPVGVPHGYDLYYLNVMAGPLRQWRFRNDPDHEWIVDKGT